MANDKDSAIKRSLENWKAAELLACSRNKKERFWNAASSRLYYSVLLLVFAEMSCHEGFKMGGSTEQHKQAREYMKERYQRSSRVFRDLEDLRNRADYGTVPISENEFRNTWKKWNDGGLYNSYLTNLKSECERVII